MPRRHPIWQAVTQYDIEVPDRPGELTKLTRLLAKESIRLDGLVAASIDDKAVLRFLAYKDAGLRRKLAKAGLRFRENQVFELEMPNRHWELHQLAKTLANRGINILSLHSAVEGENLRMVLAVDDPANAVALISKLGFEPDYAVR